MDKEAGIAPPRLFPDKSKNVKEVILDILGEPVKPVSLKSKTRTHWRMLVGHAVSGLPAKRNSSILNRLVASNAPSDRSLSDRSKLIRPDPSAPLGIVPDNRLPLKSKAAKAASRFILSGRVPAIRFGSTAALGRTGWRDVT